jgi:hypothetical protein
MTGEVDAFFISTRRRRGLRFAAIVMPIVAAWHVFGMTLELLSRGIDFPWVLWAVAAISFGGASFYYARRLRQVQRPIVEVSDQEIRWGMPTPSCQVLPMEEVRSVDWSKLGDLELLRSRAGRTLGINVSDIEAIERDRIYDAIVRRLAGAAG